MRLPAMSTGVLAASASNGVLSIVIWSVILLALLIVGFVVVSAVRKHFREDAGLDSGGSAFTLQQLRQMRRDGEINDEQYEKLRQQIIGAVGGGQAGGGESAKPPPRPRNPNKGDDDRPLES